MPDVARRSPCSVAARVTPLPAPSVSCCAIPALRTSVVFVAAVKDVKDVEIRERATACAARGMAGGWRGGWVVPRTGGGKLGEARPVRQRWRLNRSEARREGQVPQEGGAARDTALEPFSPGLLERLQREEVGRRQGHRAKDPCRRQGPVLN